MRIIQQNKNNDIWNPLHLEYIGTYRYVPVCTSTWRYIPRLRHGSSYQYEPPCTFLKSRYPYHQQSGRCIYMHNMQNMDPALLCISIYGVAYFFAYSAYCFMGVAYYYAYYAYSFTYICSNMQIICKIIVQGPYFAYYAYYNMHNMHNM